MKVSLCLGSSPRQHKSAEELKKRIAKEVKEFLGYLPEYHVESIGISASWVVWVKIDAQTERLDVGWDEIYASKSKRED